MCDFHPAERLVFRYPSPILIIFVWGYVWLLRDEASFIPPETSDIYNKLVKSYNPLNHDTED